jgi:tRNA G18 (ribose-2'-O)-methylase SpoU
MARGYFGIGIINSRKDINIGTLWRSAHVLGASFLYTIGRPYSKQRSDTMASWRHIPLFSFTSFSDFYRHIPYNCGLVGVEICGDAQPIESFSHPERCIYLLGAEDSGIPKHILEQCHSVVKLPGDYCLNVAVAGSIILYDRIKAKRLENPIH